MMYSDNSELETVPFLHSEDEMMSPSIGSKSSSVSNRTIDDNGRGFGCPGPPVGIENKKQNVNSLKMKSIKHSARIWPYCRTGFPHLKPNIPRVLKHMFCPIQKMISPQRRFRNLFILLLCCVVISLVVYRLIPDKRRLIDHKPVSMLPSQPRRRTNLFPNNQCILPLSDPRIESHKLNNDNSEQDRKNTKNNEILSVSRPHKYQTRSPARVLLICKTSLSILCQLVQEKLKALRIDFKVSVAGKNIPDLIKSSKGKGKYVTIFFEEFEYYLSMDKWNREILDKYCRAFNAGIVAFVAPQPLSPSTITSPVKFKVSPLVDLYGNQTGPLPIITSTQTGLNEFSVKKSSTMLRIIKGGQTALEKTSIGHWMTFRVDNNKDAALNYVPVVTGKGTNNKESKEEEAIVLQDMGHRDGIPKVLFSIRRLPNNSSNIKGQSDRGIGGKRKKKTDIRKQSLHWIQHVLFLDALWWTSKEKIQLSLTRYLMIDIDDIFTGRNRLRTEEVEAMRESQQRISEMYDGLTGFRYNLGFSGATFKKGPDLANKLEDDDGDEALVKYKDAFSWFPHEWQHMQPHKQDNGSILSHRMELNKKFARDHDIHVDSGYAVSPHHSGVFPVHEQLYDAWKNVWNISVTSTEEYPHLNPKRNNIRLPRRGFIHTRSGIKVLPRQTCGLFTKNLYYNEYPNGPEVLEASINGGELFQTFINNPVSIFMTHMPNYAFDRLAPYSFESVLSMLKCWTNLELRSSPPQELGEIYFDSFPDEKIPMWSNPCEDKRHEEIWSASKTCQRLPEFLVIGPQKTGTTALYKFLQIHPAIQSNFPSPTTFEELQFFSNNKNYEMGIDWYMNFFPSRELNNSAIQSNHIEDKDNTDNEDNAYDEDESAIILFEKSATYFDREVVPERAYELLPDAFLIAIIISPAKRAHSWYQHQRAHGDETALQYSFHEVITANATTRNKALKSLQSRCLEPGKYASHIERWLQFYGPQQIYIVDGEELTKDPVSVMNTLQHFLSVKPYIDYSHHLRFDVSKGYYCQVLPNGRNKCLGSGKGREYNRTIEPHSMKFLQDYYRLSNEALLKLLKNRLGYDIPQWLEHDLYEFTENTDNEENHEEK